jgi:hypothetical protein
MSQEIDYSSVLADLEARRAVLDAAIAGVRQLLGQVGESKASASPQGATMADLPQDVAPGVFHGLSISEAAKKYLQMTKTKHKTTAICDALRAGGIESASKSFYGNVFTSLKRNKEFIKLGKHWALADWHPTHVVAATAKKTKQARRRKAPKPRPVPDSKQSATKESAGDAASQRKAIG